MADGRKIPYIIEMIADDHKIRQQMSKWDWEDIMGTKGKGFGDVLVNDAKEAKDQVRRTLGGLNIDWTKILGSKEIGQLEQAVTRALSKSRREIELFAASGDTTGLENTIKYVSALGDELKGLGSSFDAASLARGMSAFMKVLVPLTAKFEALAEEPKKVEAAFDKLFSGIATSAKSVDLGKTFDVSGKIKIAMQGLKATNDEILEATESLEKYRNTVARLSGDNPATIKLAQDVEGLNQQLDEQMRKEEQLASQNKTNSAQYAATLKNIMAIENARLKLKAKPTTDHATGAELSEDFGYYEEKINKVVERISKKIEEVEGKLANTVDKSFAEIISKQISDIKLSVSLSEQAEKQFVNEINTFVKKVNQSPLERVQIQIDDAANVIEDKQVRPYGKNEGDDDANTTKLVKQIENRFDRITTSIRSKQDQIVEQTKNWRQQMLEQFKFKSGDFEFKFNDNLVEELQTLFDEYNLKINIDPTYLAEQIKTVLEGSSVSLGGGTASIDPSAMASAVMAGVRAALVGEPLTVHTPANVAQERIPEATEQVATEIEQTAKHLDIAEEYVQDVVKKIKDVAKYATKHMGTEKDSVGAKATREQFGLFGLDLEQIKLAGNDDAKIASILEQSLLQKDNFGKLIGSTLISQLSNFKGSSSKTIPTFLSSLHEVFYMLQEETQTVDEWTRKQHSKEILDAARGKAKAADVLRTVRSPIRQEKIPDIESIENAISLMSAIGGSTDDLEKLKLAREGLGDKTDEASIKEFKKVANEFYKSSTRVFYDLKKQAEDMFQGVVYLQGSKKGIVKRQSINNYKQLAKIDDDAVIVDVRVTSSLNDVSVGDVKSEYDDRRLRYGQKADYVVDKEYEEDILRRKLKYSGFKSQGTETTEINIEASIEGIKKRIADADKAIPELQDKIELLDKEVEMKQQEFKTAREILNSIQNNPKAADKDRRDASRAELKAEGELFDVIQERRKLTQEIDNLKSSQEGGRNLIKRLELTGQYNDQLSESLKLEGLIAKLEKDGAPQKELQERKRELSEIRTKLTEIATEAEAFGGLYQQSVGKEYSDAERKTYALEQLRLIEDDLITAKAQKSVTATRISKKDKEIAEVDRWGLGAGIGARELGKEKSRLASEFMKSEYVRELQEALREKTKSAIIDAEQKSREIFDEKVYEAMLKEGMNPYDQEQTHQFLETERGQQYSRDFANEVDFNTKYIWSQYDERIKVIRDQVLAEFKESMQVQDGVLSYVSKTKDENGEWVNEIVEVAVRDALRERLVAAKEILEEQQTPIQENIARLEADKKTAIEYGGIGEEELLSGEIVADQIRKEEKLAELLRKRETIIEDIADLERKGVPDSDDSVKQTNKEKERLDKEIARYEMLIRNRKKLVDMRYNESKEPTYTNEEKELHFTNQIVGYNQKIEDSLAKQEELKQKIATASEEEKEKLQYVLKQEEDKVVGWRGKVSKFEGKLQNVGTAKSEVAATKTGEISSGLLGLIKEAVGEVSIGDLTQITEILQKILDILSGNGSVGPTHNSEMDAKLARIKELEAKQQLANEQKKTAETATQVDNVKKTTTEIADPNVAKTKAHDNVRKTQIYKEIKAEGDRFYKEEVAKDPLGALRQALEKLSQIQDQNSREYVEWQHKLGKTFGAYGESQGIKNGAGFYEALTENLSKQGISLNPKQGLTNANALSSTLVEKGLVTIKEKEAKAKQSEAKAEEKITEEKKEQEKIRFTRKEKKELKKLKDETKDYNPNATISTGSEFGGFATENTLKAILEVLNKISTSGVPKSGGKSAGTGTHQNDSEQDDSEMTELERRVGALKGRFKDAISVGYLDENNADLAAFNKQLDDIANSDGTIEQLEEMRKKALALGDVVSKTVAKNKRMYSGTTEINAATRQRSNMEARGALDNADLAMVERYNKAYDELIAKHKEFAVAGTLYDPNNQKVLQNMAIKVKDLGKQLEKSVAEAEQLQQLVDNSGVYNGQSLGSKEVVGKIDDGTFEALAKKRLQELGAEHIKFDKIHKRAIGTKRLDNKTVADLEVKYNDLSEAMYAYQKAERESLTGVPAFINGFKKKFNSIMQYLSMTMSIHQVLAELRKGIQYIREIDLALTELRKVTDETEETYDKFLDTAAKTGARLGTTISAVTEATATFAKLGYSMEQATEMAESAIVYKNVGDNIASTEDAADSIISTMKGFRLEASESMAIVDRFNEVGNRFAITSQGIGEALRLSASALSEGSNSLDESIALITAANEVVNDPSSVGTALKTLTLRLRGSKTELEEAGLDIENMATTTSQLQAKLLALTGGQVDIMSDANTFKNTTQILREMAEAWEDMTDIQRASALELMGGRLLPLHIEICA